MKKYSEIYEKQGRLFRYNYKYGLAECITKATEEMKVNLSAGKAPRFAICKDGYAVVDPIDMHASDWEDKEIRDYYIEAYIVEADKPKHGGRRENAGRKGVEGGKRYTFTLTDYEYEEMKKHLKQIREA